MVKVRKFKKKAGLDYWLSQKEEITNEVENAKFWLQYANHQIKKLDRVSNNAAQILNLEDYR